MIPRAPRTTSTARAGCALALSLALAFAAGSARAAPTETPPTQVEELARQAYGENAAGKYAEAIATYMKAYEMSHASAILFNIAMIYDYRLHERALAIDYFRRYLQAPDAEPDFAQKATERLSVLKRESEEEEERAKLPPSLPPAPPPSPAPSPPQLPAPVPVTSPAPDRADQTSDAPWRITGVVAGGVGIASIGVSVVLGLIAKGKNDDANALCGESTCKTSRGVDLDHEAGRLATAATITFVTGAALVATGITLYFVVPGSRGSQAKIAVAAQPSTNGVGLRIQGSF